MKAIFELLESFITTVFSLINFLLSLVEDLIYIVALLADFVVKIPYYLSWLPSGVIAIIVAIFAVVVIYKVAGREG